MNILEELKNLDEYATELSKPDDGLYVFRISYNTQDKIYPVGHKRVYATSFLNAIFVSKILYQDIEINSLSCEEFNIEYEINRFYEILDGTLNLCRRIVLGKGTSEMSMRKSYYFFLLEQLSGLTEEKLNQIINQNLTYNNVHHMLEPKKELH